MYCCILYLYSSLVLIFRSQNPVVATATVKTVVEEGPEYEEIPPYFGTTTKSTNFDITSCPAYSSTIGQPTPQEYTEEEYDTVQSSTSVVEDLEQEERRCSTVSDEDEYI